VRQIAADGGRLVAEAVGEVETEDRVLVLRRIHVKLRLKTEQSNRHAAERIHAVFADRCPIYRSLKAAIQISTEVVFD
jgi:uncharacterized OsmC-like protein